MTTQERLYTVEDLLALPEDGIHYELFKGILSEMSPTGETHGLLTAELTIAIGMFVRQHNLGRVYGAETGFILSQNPDTVQAPDVAFTAKSRLKPLAEGYAPLAPDLAVEVVSPGNTKTELHEKVAAYFEAGTRLLWIVYPKSQAIYVYRSESEVAILKGDDLLTGGDVLPEFSLKVADIFSVLDK